MDHTKRWYQDKNRVYAGLARSSWVTAATDWFMSFAGKAVELVLYATVLYSCAQLYPGVHLPESLSLAVFLVQMGALDIGGLSLGKLAKQAHEDGNEQGATHARRLSIGLIAIMLVGVATVGIERVIPLPDQVQIGVQLVLVIARSVGSVLYGRVVHDLKPVNGQAQSSDELNSVFSNELTEALAQLQQELSNQVLELSQVFSTQLSDLSYSLAHQGDQVQGNLTEIHEAIAAHTHTLAGLSALPSAIERYERNTRQAMQDMRSSIESSAAGKPKLSLVQSEKLSDEAGELSNKGFIEAYVTKHPEARNAEIIDEATKVGLTLSQSYVSQIRKALKEQSA